MALLLLCSVFVLSSCCDDDSPEKDEIPSFISYVDILAGTYTMGSPENDPNRVDPDRVDNETQHRVILSEGFKMSKYEITNAQYCKFLNDNHIDKSGILGIGSDL